MNLTKTQVDSAKNIECEKCNNLLMVQTFLIKKISGLLMPDGKDTLIPVPVFACLKCNHVNEMFASELGLTQESK